MLEDLCEGQIYEESNMLLTLGKVCSSLVG
jgi:hypothetical protein